MNIQDKVSDTVTRNFKTSTVFKEFGIDFCCNGNITIEEVCTKKNVDPIELMEALLQTEADRNSNENFSLWNNSFLIEYIINNHHNYLRKTLPVLTQYLAKVANVHGSHTPSLVDLYYLFIDLKNDLIPHLESEEAVLFPLMEKIDKGYTPTNDEKEIFTKIEDEHKTVGSLLERINKITNNYEPPLDACNTYRVSFKYLAELEDDIHKHVHLENNILIPRFVGKE